MKKQEIILLLIFMTISTLYSFKKPNETVENIETIKEINVTIEGKYQQTLIYDHQPTINEIFITLNDTNTYGFNNDLLIDNGSILYIPSSTNLISLNNATSEQLQTIKGIGEKTAQKIIDQRNKEPYGTIEDITKVSGIGDKTYLRIREYLCP